jgi:NAD(P)H-hydrate epimerase
LRWVDIGIPEDVLDGGEGLRAYVVEPEDVIDRLPDREPEMHKGDRGRLLVIGGSAGLTGAVTLTAEAAVRAGAGLVSAGVPLSLNDILEAKLTEAMTLPLPELDVRALSRDAFDSIAIFQPGRLTALAVGPGAGRHPSTQALVRRIIREIHLPTVLDADGLFAFNGQADLLRLDAPSTKLVLTPHAGEFTALTGEDPAELRANRLQTASKWARRLGAVLVLKGAPTVIADPASETVYVNPTGSEALATGGTGDVLTGFISGFLAQGIDPLDAAIAGVYLHGWTADFIVEEWGSVYGLQAGDLVDWFPLALGFFLNPLEPD